MKRHFFLTLLLAFTALPLMGFSPTKFYCNPSQIEMTEETILLHVNNAIFETDALCVDQGGVYYTDIMLRCPKCRKTLNPKNTCECPQ